MKIRMPTIRVIRGIARALDHVEALHFAYKLLRGNYFLNASRAYLFILRAVEFSTQRKIIIPLKLYCQES